MNSPSHTAVEMLWLAEPVLECVVIAALIWRKAYRQYRWFSAYMVSEVLAFLVLYPLRAYETAYFYAYCVTATLGIILGFAVIHEIFINIFRPYHTLRDLGSVLFKWAALVMLLVAMIVSASGQALHREPLIEATLILERSIRVVQCGLIMFLLLFSRYLGISWRQRSFGIALGFGSYATIDLSLLALHLGAHISQDVANLITMSAYVLSIGIWITYSAIKETSRADAVRLLKSQRWEQSLTDIQHPAKADSLIPMFEGMVERAFTRSHSSFQAIDRVSLTPALGNDVGLSPSMPFKSSH